MNRLMVAVFATAIAMSAPVSVMFTGEAMAAKIVYVVNKNAVTDLDIKHRIAFLRLQRQGGDLRQKATDQMIDQVLRLYEAKRVGVNVSNQQVNEAYARFAQSNKLTTKQLGQILGQAGVGTEHFKDFIRSQIAWCQAVQRKAGSSGSLSRQEITRRLLERKDNKPTAMEYVLDQVIFVIPPAERGKLMARRKSEANAMRSKINGCESIRDIAKGTLDVTVRNLGRKLEPELPEEWKGPIAAAAAGQATTIRETDRGVEFLVICESRSVSDDRVAELTFRAEDLGGTDGDSLSDEYLAEVRKNAEIIRR